MPIALARVALLFAAAGCTAASLASATTFIVGDDQGWTMGVDYIAWAKGKTFNVGDKLVFNYPTAEHTVTEVGKNDYFACAGGDAVSSDRSGSTNITLTGAGTRYFICDIPGHCTIGMRLAVTVAGGDSPPDATLTGAAAGATVRPAMGSVVVAATAGAMIKLAIVQLREDGAHGDGGEQERVRSLLRRRRTELGQQQRPDHRHARYPRHALLHLRRPRPLRRRHEARRQRLRGRHGDDVRRRPAAGSSDGPRRGPRRGSGGPDQARPALRECGRVSGKSMLCTGR